MSKSISAAESNYWAHERGQAAEERVLRHFLNLNYELLFHRYKTPFAEVDLILQSPDGSWLMLEVKTIQQEHFISYRVSRRQKQRLFRARQYLQDKFQELVELHWAFVTGDEEILVFTDLQC